MPRNAADLKLVREIALAFPEVVETTSPRGMGFSLRGRLLACDAIHASAEPRSLMVRVSLPERARLIAAHPAIYYVTEHYSKHPAMLVRLARVSRDELREALGAAWLFVGERTAKKRSTRKPAAGRARKRRKRSKEKP